MTGARQLAQAATRHRELGIDDELLARGLQALRPALLDGGCSRAEAFARWEGVGIDPRDQRGVQLLGALAIRGDICQGPVIPATAASGIAREQRFVLVDEWIGDSVMPDDPLAELFVRYVDGHGPAGTADFAWWSGLTRGAARDAAVRASARVTEIEAGVFVSSSPPRRSPRAARVHLLGAFDEYYISYADRTAVCARDDLAAVGPGKNGMVRPVVLADGVVRGVWRLPSTTARGIEPLIELFAPGTVDDEEVQGALARHVEFLGLAV